MAEDLMNTINYTKLQNTQPAPGQVAPIPQFTPDGTVIATLIVASAVTIGSNMVDVRNGSMTMSQALLNGAAKGTAATIILNATARSTILQVALAATVLAGAGYLIDSAMKNPRKVPDTIQGHQ